MNPLQTIADAGILALGSFAIISIIAGAILNRHRSEILHAFGLMTLLWGSVNALVALIGLILRSEIATTPAAAQAALSGLRFDLGFDLIYILVGVLLLRARSNRGMGFGLAVALQGIILFLIDLVLIASVYAFTPRP